MKQLLVLLSLSLVVLLGGCSQSSVETTLSETQNQTELSAENDKSDLGSLKQQYPDEFGMQGNIDYSGITNYVKEHEKELNEEEIIYDFGNNPLAATPDFNYNNEIDKEIDITIDNIAEYSNLETNCSIYEAKLSPNKNKLYIKYLNDDKKGIITITHGDSTIVYKVENEEIIALSQGDGEYNIKLYVTRQGVNCTYKGNFTIMAENSVKETTYKGQSYYSNYKAEDEEFVELAEGLWKKSNSLSEYIWNSYIYTAQYPYDYEKCDDIDNGRLLRYRPDVSTLIDEQKGICLDKAAVLASLLRAKDIPAKVVFGYYKNLYHAWVEVNFNNQWLLFDPTLKMNYSSYGVENYSVSRYN